MPDVICIGLLVADVIARPLRAYPECGKLVLVESMELHAGGCAVNTAIALAKLGVPASVMGRVGDDTFGPLYRRPVAVAGHRRHRHQTAGQE